MKKTPAVFLAAAVLLSLAACGGPKSLEIRNDGIETGRQRYTLGEKYSDDELTLEAVLKPEGAKGQISWESSDESVVTVDSIGAGCCMLELNGEGVSRVTAVCGDLSATVKITVDPDPDAAEAQETAEEAEESEEEPAPLPPRPENPKDGYIAYKTENPANAPYTPDDIKNSGILDALEYYREFLKPHYDNLRLQSSSGKLMIGENKSIEYTVEDYFITSLISRVSGRKVIYTFNYEDNFLRSVSVDFGNGKVSEITMKGKGAALSSVKIGGYGGDKEEKQEYSWIQADYETGGFKVGFAKDTVFLKIGMMSSDHEDFLARVYLKTKDIKQGFAIDCLQVRDVNMGGDNYFVYNGMPAAQSAAFMAKSYIIDSSLTVNGYDCTVSWKEDEISFSANKIDDEYLLRYKYRADGSCFEAYFKKNSDTGAVYILHDGSLRS